MDKEKLINKIKKNAQRCHSAAQWSAPLPPSMEGLLKLNSQPDELCVCYLNSPDFPPRHVVRDSSLV